MQEAIIRSKGLRVIRKSFVLIAAVVLGAVMTLFAASFFFGAGSEVTYDSQPTSGNVGFSAIRPNADALPGSATISNPLSSLGSLVGSKSSPNVRLNYDSNIDMQSKTPSETLDNAVRMVTENGGNVVSLYSTEGSNKSARATFQVPPSKFVATIDDVAKLGTSVNRTVSASQTSYPATAPDGTKMSTFSLNIDLVTVGLNDRSEASTFTHAASVGWHATSTVLRVTLLVIGFTLPLLIVGVLLILLAAIVFRGTAKAITLAKPLFRLH